MTVSLQEPSARRDILERVWEKWRLDGAPDAEIRSEILASWQRSAAHHPIEMSSAPLADADETSSAFAASPLSVAVARLEGDLRSAAEDGNLVIAVTDPDTRIL